jgi:hypothetical protein
VGPFNALFPGWMAYQRSQLSTRSRVFARFTYVALSTYKVATALDTQDMQKISLNLTPERVSRSAAVTKIGDPLQHDVSAHRFAFTGQLETGTLSPFYILNRSSRAPDHTPMTGMRSEQYL